MVCAALLAHPGPFPLHRLLYTGVFLWVFLFCLFIGWFVDQWLRASAAQHIEACCIPRWIILCFFFFHFSFATIIISVHECLAGEGFEKPLLCAWVPGAAPGCPLAQALHEQAVLETEEGHAGEHGGRTPKIREIRGDAIQIDSLPVEHNISRIWAEADVLMV